MTACKDKKLRVIDSHTGDVLHQGMGHEGVKPQRAIFLKDGRIFTTGFTKRSERLYALRTQVSINEVSITLEINLKFCELSKLLPSFELFEILA